MLVAVSRGSQFFMQMRLSASTWHVPSLSPSLLCPSLSGPQPTQLWLSRVTQRLGGGKLEGNWH